jgi:hypothetical protein
VRSQLPSQKSLEPGCDRLSTTACSDSPRSCPTVKLRGRFTEPACHGRRRADAQVLDVCSHELAALDVIEQNRTHAAYLALGSGGGVGCARHAAQFGWARRRIATGSSPRTMSSLTQRLC